MTERRRIESTPPTWRIAVDGDETSAVFEPALAPGDAVYVCAHGAGGRIDDAGVRAASRVLSARGLGVVRFNFLYREKGAGAPDPMPRLSRCFEAVADHVRSVLKPSVLILGGRSMGGRAASMLAAGGYRCDGLLLLAYPLHPAGRPDKLRTAHFARIEVPVLCLNGTRDALCDRALMERSIAPFADRWTMHWLEGADHGFHVLKAYGRSDEDVLQEVADAWSAWRVALGRRR
jgi:predicted alpha/beta-hydrolase family hydrolase